MPHEPDKSIGAEETFARDVDDPEVVLRELLRLSEKTAARLRSAGLAGRTVSLKVRFADFTTITRSRTLPEATDVAAALYGTARMLYEALGLDRARLRLVGIRVEQLVVSESAPHQLLLGERNRGRREVEQAADRAALRFGNGAVRPATLVGGEGSRHPPEKPAGDQPVGGSDGQRERGPDRSPERRPGPSGGRTSGPFGDRSTHGRNLPNG